MTEPASSTPTPPPGTPGLESRLSGLLEGKTGRYTRWICFLLFAGCFAYLAAISWRKWPEILVDYGVQLYVPWQLATGKVLYRDVMYLPGGPLSQYSHAILFKLFGVSFTTLITANLCLIVGFFCLLYRLFLRATHWLTALLICTAVLFLFAFSQSASDGNYNFLCPYSYEAFHGLLLSIAAIAALCRWVTSGRPASMLLAGLCYGGVFLTKPDLFLALSMSVAAAVFVRQMMSTGEGRPLAPSFLRLGIGFAVPIFVFLLYFTAVWRFTEALKAVGNAWIPLLTSPAAHNAYYRWCLGLDTPGILVQATLYYAAYALIGVAFLAVAARRLTRGGISAGVVVLVLVYALYKSWNPAGWNAAGHALPSLMLPGVALVAWRWWQSRKTPQAQALVLPLLWSVFALFLLAKMGLFIRLWHYGFYLAMPAVAFVILLVIGLLPRELARFQVSPLVFRLLAVIFLGWGIAQIVGMSNQYYRQRILAVGDGGDRLYTPTPIQSPLGYGIKQSLDWLKQNTSPTNTLLVLPEGAMVNYLSRRTNSTPYTVFSLPEIQAYGESNMVTAFATNRPDFVMVVHRNSVEYGVKLFGLERGYGYDIMQWVRTNYSPVWLLGDEPLKETNQFGILMLRRNNLFDPDHRPSLR